MCGCWLYHDTWGLSPGRERECWPPAIAFSNFKGPAKTFLRFHKVKLYAIFQFNQPTQPALYWVPRAAKEVQALGGNAQEMRLTARLPPAWVRDISTVFHFDDARTTSASWDTASQRLTPVSSVSWQCRIPASGLSG